MPQIVSVLLHYRYIHTIFLYCISFAINKRKKITFIPFKWKLKHEQNCYEVYGLSVAVFIKLTTVYIFTYCTNRWCNDTMSGILFLLITAREGLQSLLTTFKKKVFCLQVEQLLPSAYALAQVLFHAGLLCSILPSAFVAVV